MSASLTGGTDAGDSGMDRVGRGLIRYTFSSELKSQTQVTKIRDKKLASRYRTLIARTSTSIGRARITKAAEMPAANLYRNFDVCGSRRPAKKKSRAVSRATRPVQAI